MKKTFTALPKPIVACIFAPPSVEEAMATMRNGEFAGSDAFAIHLRMDKALLTRENFARIAQATAKPVMFLLYRGDAAGWPAPASDEERVERLKMARPWIFRRTRSTLRRAKSVGIRRQSTGNAAP